MSRRRLSLPPTRGRVAAINGWFLWAAAWDGSCAWETNRSTFWLSSTEMPSTRLARLRGACGFRFSSCIPRSLNISRHPPGALTPGASRHSVIHQRGAQVVKRHKKCLPLSRGTVDRNNSGADTCGQSLASRISAYIDPSWDGRAPSVRGRLAHRQRRFLMRQLKTVFWITAFLALALFCARATGFSPSNRSLRSLPPTPSFISIRLGRKRIARCSTRYRKVQKLSLTISF